jgi:hypothetical protein
MPEFTMPLKSVIKATGGRVVVINGISRLIDGDIGLNHFPIFSEEHRNILVGKIIDHYWNQEIGFETIDMFRMRMRIKMNEIMPYYNKLYETELIKFDPLSTVDLKTVSAQAIKTLGKAITESEQNTTDDQEASTLGKSDTTTTTAANSRQVNSDFPQQMLSGNGDYATSAADGNSASTSTGGGQETGESTAKSTQKATGDITQDSTTDTDQTSNSATTGYQGSASALLTAYRSTILNIDPMVIADLDPLFMQIWSAGSTIPGRDFI